MLNRLINQKS